MVPEVGHTGTCYCPICQRELSGQLVADEHVWLVRNCADHGRIKTMLFADPAFFAEATALASADSKVSRHTCLVAEVTERCDVGCATCSAASTMLGSEQDAQQFVALALSRARATSADVVALSGGEPLMREDLWSVVDALHGTIPKIVLITSGRNFESNPTILANATARSEWLEIYLQFDSLQDSILRTLRTPTTTAKLRQERLKLAAATGAATTAVCVIPPDSSEQAIGELAVFCRDAGASGITFQPLRQLGRHQRTDPIASSMSTIDYIQGSALAALGVVNAQPRPFAQQPFDMSVAFVRGAYAAISDRFFLTERRDPSFRVATSSYWDFTNYFAPFANSGRYYFHFSDGQSLNARYFNPVPHWPGKVAKRESLLES